MSEEKGKSMCEDFGTKQSKTEASNRASLKIQDEASLLLTLESREPPDLGGSCWPSIVSRHREPSS